MDMSAMFMGMFHGGKISLDHSGDTALWLIDEWKEFGKLVKAERLSRRTGSLFYIER